jgi:O-antigen ligase
VRAVKVTARNKEKSSRWPFSRLDTILAMVVILGAFAGLVSTRLPVLYTFAFIGGIALFVLIYRYLMLGLVLGLILNLTIPQAGPTADLGLQIQVIGEPRGLHFNLHEIVFFMVLVAGLIHIGLRVLELRRETPPWDPVWEYLYGLVKNPISFAILLYVLTSILAGFIGLIHGGDSLVLTYRLIRTVFFVYIFFMVINIVRTRERFQWLIIAMLVCFTLVALFGIVQGFIGQERTEWLAEHFLKRLGYPDDVNFVAGESEAQAYRINSTFLHPNVLGGYLVFAIPFFISFLTPTWRKKRYWLWLLLLICLGINLGALYLTGSRAAWVAGGCIALLYGIFGLMDKRMWLAAATAVLIIALVVVIINPPGFVKKRFTGLSAKEAAEVRLYQYKLAVDYFMEFPFFGLGMGMEGERLIENNIRQQWAAVENAFLTYLVSHGLIGLTAFLLLFIIYWAILLYARKRSPDDPFIYYNSEAFILGMVGFAVANMFGAWLLFAIPMVTLFWFYLGMGGALFNLYRQGEEPAAETLPEAV